MAKEVDEILMACMRALGKEEDRKEKEKGRTLEQKRTGRKEGGEGKEVTE